MSQYLLSVHGTEGVQPPPMSPEEMQASMEKVMALEAEMKEGGTFVFGGKLTDHAEAQVLRKNSGAIVVTDGPFAEAKEHIGGFYIINADSLDDAHAWATRVVECINAPIEVRPFFDMPGS